MTEVFNRVRTAGATGALTLRADSGFYSQTVVDACSRAKVAYSITIKSSKGRRAAYEAIAERDWTPIPYWLEGGADVAEIAYRPFGRKKGKEVRLIVRRTKPTPGSQLALFATYSYHAFITNREGETRALEADHRRHAEIELIIRDLKEGAGCNHMPSGFFGANSAWMAIGAIAHNLARRTSRIGGISDKVVTTPTMRRRYFAIPGHLTRSGRRQSLHLAKRWPWREKFVEALRRLRAVEILVT